MPRNRSRSPPRKNEKDKHVNDSREGRRMYNKHEFRRYGNRLQSYGGVLDTKHERQDPPYHEQKKTVKNISNEDIDNAISSNDEDNEFFGPMPNMSNQTFGPTTSLASGAKVLMGDEKAISTLLQAADRKSDPSQIKNFNVFGCVENDTQQQITRVARQKGARANNKYEDRKSEIKEKIEERASREQRIVNEFKQMLEKKNRSK